MFQAPQVILMCSQDWKSWRRWAPINSGLFGCVCGAGAGENDFHNQSTLQANWVTCHQVSWLQSLLKLEQKHPIQLDIAISWNFLLWTVTFTFKFFFFLKIIPNVIPAFGGGKDHNITDISCSWLCFFCVLLLLMKQAITKRLIAHETAWITCTLGTMALLFCLLWV